MPRLSRTPRPLDLEAAELRVHPRLAALRQLTPAQAAAWVDANVTNLAEAKDVLRALAALGAYLLRRGG